MCIRDRLFTQLQDVVKMDLNRDQIVGMAGVLDKASLDEIKRNSFTENYKRMNDGASSRGISSSPSTPPPATAF